MKKKLLAFVMAAMMVGSVPVTASASSESLAPSGLSAEGLGGYKIGFFYMPTSDVLSQQFHNTLDFCASQTNCEMEYYDMTAWDSEAMSAAVETLVSNGCDGVIMVLGSSPALYEYMEKNDVHYVALTRSYTDELAKVVDGSEYNCGFVGDLGGNEGGNFKTGYDIAMVLADEGCKSIALVGGSEGETMNDERIAGMKAAAEESGMEVVAEYRGGDFITGYADILSSYGSELDGIACSGGGDNGVAAIQAAGLTGQIKLVQVDAPSGDTAAYLDAGMLTATYAGASTYMVDAYMQLFNALSGADRLWNEGSRIVPMFNGFIVRTKDEYESAVQYTDGEVAGGLLPDEILSFCSLTGGDEMTVEERQALVESYQSPDYWNIENISARVGAYLEQ
ncbi:MAG: substrate-binding domain-containing protein [Eubacteriales bacterium]|nr:substrate-binding domain-containing protein [Eubacteriales bacterium]